MSQTWETVANAFITLLKASSDIDNASNGYPEHDIDESHLSYAVLMPPVMDFMPMGVSGSYQIDYSFELRIHILALSENQERLVETDMNTCANFAQSIFGYLSSNRLLTIGSSKVPISIGKAKVARLRPATDANRGNFAGITVDINLKV